MAERWAAVGGFLESLPNAVHPVTRTILEGSKGWDAAAAFRAQYWLRELAREADKVWREIEVLLLPTTSRIYTVAEVPDESYQTNATLGKYKNFMNLLDLSAVAVPAGKARGGRARWGVTLAAPAGWDLARLGLAGRFESAPFESGLPEHSIPVVVCGAHLEGLALRWQLADRGAKLRARTRTAPVYRMFAMPASDVIPPRLALIRDEQLGVAIEVEVWDLPPADFGDFVSKIPGPRGIGKVMLEDGGEVPAFIAGPRAVVGAEEIRSFGVWKAWLAR